jgi:predicted Zn-dependent protease
MLRKFLSALILVPWAVSFTNASNLNQNVLFRAMTDELGRNIKQLKMEKMSLPYYISYRIADAEQVSIEASFGGITNNKYEHNRPLYVDLRVGGYKFDNSNFVPGELGSFIFNPGQNTESQTLPLEDDYDAIRHDLWLATDEAYKNALEFLSQKKAALQDQTSTEQLDDFSKVIPFVYNDSTVKLEIDRALWQDRIRQFSALFKKFPTIQNSTVSLVVKISNQYFIDSETNQYHRGDLIAQIDVSARTQAKNGDTVRSSISFCAPTPAELPAPESIESKIRTMAEELSRATELEPGKNYTGPVLFLDQAAGDFFYQIIGRGLSDPRSPLFGNPMMEQLLTSGEGGLVGKFNQQILPAGFSVWDDPLTKTWNNRPLVGGYGVDDQGVGAKRVDLVKQGKVSGFLMSRLPTKEVKESNGHGRSAGGGRIAGHIGNLFITGSNGLSAEALTDAFLKLCKEQGLEYGIVVTKLASPVSSDMLSQVMAIFSSFQTGGQEQPLLTEPITAYKLSVDGKRIEPVRNLKFEGTTLRVLRDMCAVGAEPGGYNFIASEKFGEGIPVSVIAPSIVVKEMELTPGKSKPAKPPFLSHPYFQGR